jgi:hypothetical protein
MVNIFEVQIQYEDKTHLTHNPLILLKQRNIEQLNVLVNDLTSSLMSTTETELKLGMRTRDLEYSQHEFKMLQSHFDALK